jgi:iron(III) transport system permease protein
VKAFSARADERILLGAAVALVGFVAVVPVVLPALDLGGAIDVPWALFARSALLAGAVTALALAAGVPLGVLLGRSDVPGRAAALALHAFPMFLPPFLLGLGWMRLFGRDGAVGSEASSAVLFSEAGAVLVLALAFTPVVTVLTALGLRGVDPSLEEAARTVARPVRVAARILVPLAKPAIGLAAVLVFAMAFSELGVPTLLRVQVYPTTVLSRLGGFDCAPGEAFGLILPLVALALALLSIERAVVGREFASLGIRGADRPSLPLGPWRAPATVAAWGAAALPAVPVGVLGWVATSGGGVGRVGPFLGNALWVGPAAGAAAATVVVAVGLVVGRARVHGVPGAGVADGAAMLSFFVPSALLGVGIVAQWNRPATAAIYDGVAILVVGYVARYVAIGVRAAGVIVAQSHPHLEEAAAASGAGLARRVARVVVPVHARGLAGVWLLALVLCLRDLDTVVLFYPAGREPLAVRIFTLEANGGDAVVAALATVQVVLTLAALIAGAVVLRRRTP